MRRPEEPDSPESPKPLKEPPPGQSEPREPIKEPPPDKPGPMKALRQAVCGSPASHGLTVVSTGAASTKLRLRRSGPKATANPNITIVTISKPASAQL